MARPARARKPYLLRLETLEDRITPGVIGGGGGFVVNDSGDFRDITPGDGIADTGRVNDNGDPIVTLRAAIEEANAHAGIDRITFNIPDQGSGAGPGVIRLESALPTIIEAVVIDGYSQPGAQPYNPDNEQPSILKVVIDGGAAGEGSSGLVIDDTAGLSQGSLVIGLVVQNFSGYGIEVHSAGNQIEGNYIGTTADGLGAAGNGAGGLLVRSGGGSGSEANFGTLSSPNQIGGPFPSQRNVIGGNGGPGIVVEAAFDEGQSGDAGSVLIQGNYIGVGADGASALPNAGHGIRVNAGGRAVVGNDAYFGGGERFHGNRIEYNEGAGVAVLGTGTALILENRIFFNQGLGIDLAADGVTANDAGDADEGPNDLLNKPVIDSVQLLVSTQRISGHLDGLANTRQRIDFYASTDHQSDSGDAAFHLGYVFVTTDEAGHADFVFSADFQLEAGLQPVTATASVEGMTSEVSSHAFLTSQGNAPEAAAFGLFDVEDNTFGDPRERYTFITRFGDPDGIDQQTIDGDEVEVVGPDGTVIPVTLDSFQNSEEMYGLTTGNYSFPAPGGTWDVFDNGLYYVRTRAGSLADNEGNLIGETVLGYFTVHLTRPAARGTFADVTTAGGEVYSFDIVYKGASDIDVSTLGDGDIRVGISDVFSLDARLVHITPTENAREVIATYAITPPGDFWDLDDNGTYFVAIQDDAVSDVNGTAVVGTELGEFQVDILIEPPTATATLHDVSRSSSLYQFSVTYTNTIAIDTSSINNCDILITGPDDFERRARLVDYYSPSDNYTTVEAVYEFDPPGYEWNAADNGTYHVYMEAEEVSNVQGTFVAEGELGCFTVDIPLPRAEATFEDVTHGGAECYEFTVTYTDCEGIDPCSLGGNDVKIYGPDGFRAYATLVDYYYDGDCSDGGQANDFTVLSGGSDNSDDCCGSTLVATYRFTPPGDQWNAADNGTYSVYVRTNSVKDTTGDAVPAGKLGCFTVGIPLPRAEATFTDVTRGGGECYEFTVTYTDCEGIDLCTLGDNDIKVTGPDDFCAYATLVDYYYDGACSGGGQTDNFTVLSGDASDDCCGSTLVVTYRFTPPGDQWNAADNGTYSVYVRPNSVKDTTGDAVPAGKLGCFTVDIPLPRAEATFTDVTRGGAECYEFTVTYTDCEGIDPCSLGGNDIKVYGPDGFRAYATLVDYYYDGDCSGGGQASGFTVLSGDSSDDCCGSTLVATYRFTPPDGRWNAADNGTYSVYVRPNSVFDNTCDAVPAGKLGCFEVDIPLPRAEATFEDVTHGGGECYEFTVTYTDCEGIDPCTLGGNDIKVTGPDGFRAYATLVGYYYDDCSGSCGSSDTTVLSEGFGYSDGGYGGNCKTLIATYRFTPPGGQWNAADNGTYTVYVRPNSVFDNTCDAVPAGKLGCFEVDIPLPRAEATFEDVTHGGGECYEFTVTYTDCEGIDPCSLGGNDIKVYGPDGFRAYATLVGYHYADDCGGSDTKVLSEGYGDSSDGCGHGATLIATYRFTPPGGQWNAADNGTYTAYLRPYSVFDNTCDAVPAGKLGCFTVDIPLPRAAATFTDVTVAGGEYYEFTVTYTDCEGIDPCSLGDNDVKVTGPDGFRAYATLVGYHYADGSDCGETNVESTGYGDHCGDGKTLVATYRFTPPGGVWNAADNGTYSVYVRPHSVFDNTCDAVPAGKLGCFEVDIPLPPAPVIIPVLDDAGEVPNDGSTTDRTLSVVGTAAPDSTVELFMDGDSLGTTTANEHGEWKFDYTGTAVALGTHAFTAVATTPFGDTSVSSSDYVVHIVPPAAPRIFDPAPTTSDPGTPAPDPTRDNVQQSIVLSPPGGGSGAGSGSDTQEAASVVPALGGGAGQQGGPTRAEQNAFFSQSFREGAGGGGFLQVPGSIALVRYESAFALTGWLIPDFPGGRSILQQFVTDDERGILSGGDGPKGGRGRGSRSPELAFVLDEYQYKAQSIAEAANSGDESPKNFEAIEKGPDKGATDAPKEGGARSGGEDSAPPSDAPAGGE